MMQLEAGNVIQAFAISMCEDGEEEESESGNGRNKM